MADLKYWIDASLVWVWKEEERGNDLQYFKIIRLSKHLEAGLGKNINRNVEELFFFKIKLLICQIARLHKVLGTHWRFIYIFNLVAQRSVFPCSCTYTLSQLILWLHLFFSKDYWNVFKRKGFWDDWSLSHRCLGLNLLAVGVRTLFSQTWVRKGPGSCFWPLVGHPAGSVVSGLECPELIINAISAISGLFIFWLEAFCLREGW